MALLVPKEGRVAGRSAYPWVVWASPMATGSRTCARRGSLARRFLELRRRNLIGAIAAFPARGPLDRPTTGAGVDIPVRNVLGRTYTWRV